MNNSEHTGRRDRVRNRFLDEGINNFAEHEVLELLLYYAIPIKNTNELAHRLLKEFSSLAGVFEAPINSLVERCGLSKNVAILLGLVPHLSRRYLMSRWGNRIKLSNSNEAGDYAVSLFVGECNEAFYIICLDNSSNVIMAKKIHQGTINETHVYPRLIVEEILANRASGVILTHNHPGGTKKPSKADINVTKKIIRALKPLSIMVVDHIIVAGMDYFSMAENDMLEE